MANRGLGPSAAGHQIALLTDQERRLAAEAEHLALRQRYVRLKIDYWHAVDAGDEARSDLLAGEARSLADELTRGKKQ